MDISRSLPNDSSACIVPMSTDGDGNIIGPTDSNESSSSVGNNSNNGIDQSSSSTSSSPPIEDDPHLRSLLSRKRLSEGHCIGFNAVTGTPGAISAIRGGLGAAYCLARKNSLHLIDPETLNQRMPPLTEGKPMQHMRSTTSTNTTSSAGQQQQSLESFGSGNIVLKRNYSQDDTAVSSSTSLERSPTNTNSSSSHSRRRSSTVSQCSSVLSESARQQLNFDLSPDLPPDSSLIEANALDGCTVDSVTNYSSDYHGTHPMERPQSPEPDPTASGDFSGREGVSAGSSLEMRPISRMSQCLDELMLLDASSPDSVLGDSNSNSNSMDHQVIDGQLDGRLAAITQPAAAVLTASAAKASHRKQHRTTSETNGQPISTGNNISKRAHTPCVKHPAAQSHSPHLKSSNRLSKKGNQQQQRCVSSSPNCGAQATSATQASQANADCIGADVATGGSPGANGIGEIATH